MTNSSLKMLTKNQTVILGHNVLAKWNDTKIIEYIGKLKARSQRQQKMSHYLIADHLVLILLID
jgi:hypothetical protein